MSEIIKNILNLQTIRTGQQANVNDSIEEAWLFISIKNRQFTRTYIDWFIDYCHFENRNGVICPVDAPYRFNKMAELNIDQLSLKEENKHTQVSWEVSRKVQKALNAKNSSFVRIQSWNELDTNTPKDLKSEISDAFKARGLFYSTITSHVAYMKECDDLAIIERYCKFFLAELPVLFYVYYRGEQIIDVYPGEQPIFFRQFEEGMFEKELPICTQFIKNGHPFIYMQTYKEAELSEISPM
jgi:hypothetical protein